MIRDQCIVLYFQSDLIQSLVTEIDENSNIFNHIMNRDTSIREIMMMNLFFAHE